MARAARLLALIQLLRQHRAPVTAQALAARLNASVRSIYRDVATLREQGASIEGEAGAGYMLRPGFMLPPLMFSDDELQVLMLGLLLARQRVDAQLGQSCEGILAKIRAVLPLEARKQMDEVVLLASPSGPLKKDRVAMAHLRLAIRENRKVQFAYADREAQVTSRTAWPLGISYFEATRILIAWCELRRDFRGFRTDRMRSLVVHEARIPKSRLLLLREWKARERIDIALSMDA
jgi:predicted DNA-binding transcriptional regulator YafY